MERPDCTGECMIPDKDSGVGLHVEHVGRYRIGLRLSDHCRVRFLDETIYCHRVHGRQTTQRGLDREKVLADRAKERAFSRRRIAAGGYEGLVSIVVLSVHRPEMTKNCLTAITRHTPFRHEIVLVDSASELGAAACLRALVPARDTVTPHELPRNLGVAGDLNFGASQVRGDFPVFLDNDIGAGGGWLAVLLIEMEAETRLTACCCRVVFPDGTVQLTGGGKRAGSLCVRFDLFHPGRQEDDLATLEQTTCDRVPGGAMIFREAAFDVMPHNISLEAGYEDSDWSITARRARHALGNAALATAIHRHLEFYQAGQRDVHYGSQRYEQGKRERTLILVNEKYGLFIDEEDLYRTLGYPNSEAFIERALAGRGGRG